MNSALSSLLDHGRNVYSQSGEDGLLSRCLELLPERDAWCVEFGAWDGIHLSNTRTLIESRGYAGVLIEADPGRFRQLVKNLESFPSVIPVRALVGFGIDDGLDRILSALPVPESFDLLSIDIDGNDYHVWKALRNYRPKLVCIEFNPTMPPEVDYVQPADPAISRGSSLSAMRRLGNEKGYRLVCATAHNGIFVKEEYFGGLGIPEMDLAEIWTDRSLFTHLSVGFDGTVQLHGHCRLPWHGLAIAQSDVQVLPRWLRRYPPRYSRGRKLLYSAYWRWRAACRRIRAKKYGEPPEAAG